MYFKGFGGNKLKNFKQIIAKQISKATQINEKELETYIETPKDTKNGDYSFPCFRLAKELKKAPPVIANEIKEKLEQEIEENKEIEKIEVVGGYLNFFINKSVLASDNILEIEKVKSLNDEIINMYSNSNEISVKPMRQDQPNNGEYFRGFLYDINWEFPYYDK